MSKAYRMIQLTGMFLIERPSPSPVSLMLTGWSDLSGFTEMTSNLRGAGGEVRPIECDEAEGSTCWQSACEAIAIKHTKRSKKSILHEPRCFTR